MTELLLSTLKIGEKGCIKGFNDELTALKLMEMGCLPGEEVVVEQYAPLGDPMAISVSGVFLSLRLKEASCMLISKVE